METFKLPMYDNNSTPNPLYSSWTAICSFCWWFRNYIKIYAVDYAAIEALYIHNYHMRDALVYAVRTAWTSRQQLKVVLCV